MSILAQSLLIDKGNIPDDLLDYFEPAACNECFICRMVQVGREIKRVLRDDGSFWLNFGDGFQDKQLQMMPARVALALQADGWYLRSEIIWNKKNPMPESVTDRPTKAHEYVFLLTKQPRYFYDQDAIREPHVTFTEKSRMKGGRGHFGKVGGTPEQGKNRGNPNLHDGRWDQAFHPSGRNKRTVWTIATQPFPGSHFATFPEKLVEPMIKAGTSEHGCCPECGGGWKRVTEITGYDRQRWKPGEDQYHTQAKGKHGKTSFFTTGDVAVKQTTGFSPTCAHDHDPIPCTVLDLFCGSGTTGVVARRLGRHFVGIDLSMEYLRLSRERLDLTALEAWNEGRSKIVQENWADMPLFNHE